MVKAEYILQVGRPLFNSWSIKNILYSYYFMSENMPLSSHELGSFCFGAFLFSFLLAVF